MDLRSIYDRAQRARSFAQGGLVLVYLVAGLLALTWALLILSGPGEGAYKLGQLVGLAAAVTLLTIMPVTVLKLLIVTADNTAVLSSKVDGDLRQAAAVPAPAAPAMQPVTNTRAARARHAAAGQALNDAKESILEFLVDQAEARRIDIARQTGLPMSLAREALVALERDGHVQRVGEPVAGAAPDLWQLSDRYRSAKGV